MGKQTPLKEKINERGLSQLEVASASGIERSRFYLASNGWQNLRSEEQQMIARILKADVREIFPHKKDPHQCKRIDAGG